MSVRTITSRYAGTCGDPECVQAFAAGDLIQYGGRGRVAHVGCSLDAVAAGPTTRERKAARADRLRDWSAGQRAKSEAEHAKVDQIAGMIPMGQPILVGHHSERRARRDADRIDRGMSRAIDHGRKADEMARRAANIDDAADRAIYSDDPDAIERLEERIAGLEAERDRWNAYNRACKKSGPDAALELLDDAQRAEVAVLRRVCGWRVRPDGSIPGVTGNLAGNIRRNRERLTALRGQQG